MSNVLGSKRVDGLRLYQVTWSKSKNLLRNSSQVLASAEHYLSATGALLQDLEDEGIAEFKSLLLQLNKALGASQVLVPTLLFPRGVRFLTNLLLMKLLRIHL